MEKFELKFWNKYNECITSEIKIGIILKTENEVKEFLNKFTCKDAIEVTVDHYRDNIIINSYSYGIA